MEHEPFYCQVKGHLSLYDYYSIRPDSEEQWKINSLKKRSVDGDYQQKEMDEVLDKRPSIEKLCRTVLRRIDTVQNGTNTASCDHILRSIFLRYIIFLLNCHILLSGCLLFVGLNLSSDKYKKTFFLGRDLILLEAS